MPVKRVSITVLVALVLVTACGTRSLPESDAAGAGARSDQLPESEWKGADEAPAALASTMVIADDDEPGERLVLTGTVLQPDGTTPAPNVVLYAYHTNDEGIYAKRGDETGNGRRHGHLRGWLRTGADGAYRIDTIRPAPYPNRTEPSHVHMTVKEADREEYWIDSVMFEGDPLLTGAVRERLPLRGGSGIVELRRDDVGVWRGVRDIVLMP